VDREVKPGGLHGEVVAAGPAKIPGADLPKEDTLCLVMISLSA
jgi:hypothetical protein